MDTATYRPLQGGCSVGTAAEDSAGTLGGFVWDNTDQTIVLLTCNHVLSPDNETIPADTNVVQPAILDGGTEPASVIGQTKRIIPIPQQTQPVGPIPVTAVDCAVASVTVGFSDDVIDVGPAIFVIEDPVLGTLVKKRGRTTELTTNGQIVSVDVSWTYERPLGQATVGLGNSVFNVGSTDGNPFIEKGDSGSIIFDQSQSSVVSSYPAIGMLFAGGALDGGAFGTLMGASMMSAVFSALDLDTVCSGVINQLLGAIGGDRASTPQIQAKAAELRGLRDTVLTQTPAGQMVAALVARNAAIWSTVWLTDETARGLTVRALGPWISAPSTSELLETVVDAETIGAWGALAEYMSQVLPSQEAAFRALHAVIAAHAGKRVREVLAAGLLAEA